MPLSKQTVWREMEHMEYAVRGPIVIRAGKINEDLQNGRGNYPFKSVIFCNVGNPQVLGNDYLTFPRQVLSLLAEPRLMDNPRICAEFPKDVVERARRMHKATGHSGGYTPADGIPSVRNIIAKAIERRDDAGAGKKLPVAHPSQIFLTNGASSGIIMALRLLINNGRDGVLCPLPQYPLYTATIQMYEGTLVPYYLDEDHGWGVNVAELEEQVVRVGAMGITIRGMVVINPGNPTGRILSKANMDDVVRFCHKHGIMLLADEVYQENIYEGTWHSFRERLLSMGAPYTNEVQLVSFHSTSKGMLGECGRRGGYLQMRNFPKDLYDAFLKVPALDMCANITGQWLTELMMDPPRPGDESYPLYHKEYTALFESYKKRARDVVKALNGIRGLHCLPIEGAFYAFARLELPHAFIQAAKANGKAADEEWCSQLLERTGLVTLSGHGFGQRPGTYHFRTTIMPREKLMEDMVERIRSFQEYVFETYAAPAKAKL